MELKLRLEILSKWLQKVTTDDFYYDRDAIGVCEINNLDYFFKVNKISLTYRKNSLKQSTI